MLVGLEKEELPTRFYSRIIILSYTTITEEGQEESIQMA